MPRRVFAAVWNLLIAVVIFWAWGSMAFHVGSDGLLTAPGLGSLKYFTVLSNLLQGAVSLAWAGHLLRTLRGGADRVARPLRLLRYAGVVSVTLTFATVLFFLGPVFGYASMFAGVSFWLHLVAPVAAIGDFCLLDREETYVPREALAAMIPMLIYAVGYVANLLINGVGEWPNTNDWYGFARGGVPGAAVSFAVIAAGTWGIALLLRLPHRRRG